MPFFFFFFFFARGWVSIFVAFSIFLSRQWSHVHLVLSCNVTSHLTSAITELPRWLVARIFATRVAEMGSVPTFSVEIFRIESYSHSCGYPARRLVFLGQCWDWLAQCQYTVTWWNRKFYLQLVSHCGSMYNLSVQIHLWDTLACCLDIKQQTNKHAVTELTYSLFFSLCLFSSFFF